MKSRLKISKAIELGRKYKHGKLTLVIHVVMSSSIHARCEELKKMLATHITLPANCVPTNQTYSQGRYNSYDICSWISFSQMLFNGTRQMKILSLLQGLCNLVEHLSRNALISGKH